MSLGSPSERSKSCSPKIKNFGDLIFRRGHQVPGIVLLRTASLGFPTSSHAFRLAAAIERYGDYLATMWWSRKRVFACDHCDKQISLASRKSQLGRARSLGPGSMGFAERVMGR